MSKKNIGKQIPHGTCISGCNFNLGNVTWDAKAVATVQTVAQGLLNLTELFKAQGVSFDSLLTIDNSPAREEGSCQKS